MGYPQWFETLDNKTVKKWEMQIINDDDECVAGGRFENVVYRTTERKMMEYAHICAERHGVPFDKHHIFITDVKEVFGID